MKKVVDKSIYYRLNYEQNIAFALIEFSKEAKLQGWTSREISRVTEQVINNEKSAKSILMMYCK